MASGFPARAATAAARSRSKWRSGTTASSSPCASKTGPWKAAMARIALTSPTRCPRGRRNTRFVSHASGYAIGSGIGRRASRNVWRVRRYGSAGPGGRHERPPRVGSAAAAARIAPIPPIECPGDRPRLGHPPAGPAAHVHGRPARRDPNSPPLTRAAPPGAIRPVAAHVEPADTWKPAACSTTWASGKRPVARPTPSRGPAPRPGPGAPPRAGMKLSRRQRRARATATASVLERHAAVGRGGWHLVAAGIAGTGAIGEREPICQPDLGGSDGGGNAGATNGAHTQR